MGEMYGGLGGPEALIKSDLCLFGVNGGFICFVKIRVNVLVSIKTKG